MCNIIFQRREVGCQVVDAERVPDEFVDLLGRSDEMGRGVEGIKTLLVADNKINLFQYFADNFFQYIYCQAATSLLRWRGPNS